MAAIDMAASDTGASRPADDARGGAGGRAPGQLETLRAFVNTLDIEAGTDELGTPFELASWLADHGLTDHGLSAADAAVTAAELDLAVRMREGLRAVLRAHAAGQSGPAGSAAPLREIAGALRARLCVDASGEVRAVPDGDGAAAGLAALMLIAAEAATAGNWPRLKVCSADHCEWAFYDRSPARTGHWCSMAICGSRAKSRSYRERLRA
jgi:predicted RNA-binding Zn ribbon-like protein